MKKKIKIFQVKNDYLRKDLRFKEVDIEEYFRVIFTRNNILPFQSLKNYEPLKYNALMVEVDVEKSKTWILTEDLSQLDFILDKNLVVTSPITYIGRNRKASNARYCYGFAFDIDGVGEAQIRDILYQMTTRHIPTANLIVNSGNGVHLYYLFKEPIALFDNIKVILKNFKYHLTERLWNAYTSSIKEPQFQGIFQGFRLPGTKTKFGEIVTVFENIEQDYYVIDELNEFVFPEYKLDLNELEMINSAKYSPNRLSKKKAKELYPDWYERRIIKGEKRGKWNIKRDLYDWWLRKLRTSEVREGHRYFCLMSLAMYAIKCNIDFEELKKDAYELLEPFESITIEENNHFTEEDIKDALKAYLENYSTFPRKDIEKLSGIRIDANKRNYRKQKIHLMGARAIQEINDKVNGTNWRLGNGRKSKKEIVKKWKLDNFNGKKSECILETGLSKPTVYKHWNG